LPRPYPKALKAQPAHAAGAEMVVVHDVFLDEVGLVSMSVPKPSAMFLDLAETQASRAVRLRPKLASQIRPIKYGQPDSSNRRFSNEQLVFDFLQEAMAAVLLTYTALDNATNEAMPGDFSMADAAGNTVDRAQIEGHWGDRQAPLTGATCNHRKAQHRVGQTGHLVNAGDVEAVAGRPRPRSL
jgi:hypothetical protein